MNEKNAGNTVQGFVPYPAYCIHQKLSDQCQTDYVLCKGSVVKITLSIYEVLVKPSFRSTLIC